MKEHEDRSQEACGMDLPLQVRNPSLYPYTDQGSLFNGFLSSLYLCLSDFPAPFSAVSIVLLLAHASWDLEGEID